MAERSETSVEESAAAAGSAGRERVREAAAAALNGAPKAGPEQAGTDHDDALEQELSVYAADLDAPSETDGPSAPAPANADDEADTDGKTSAEPPIGRSSDTPEAPDADSNTASGNASDAESAAAPDEPGEPDEPDEPDDTDDTTEPADEIGTSGKADAVEPEEEDDEAEPDGTAASDPAEPSAESPAEPPVEASTDVPMTETLLISKRTPRTEPRSEPQPEPQPESPSKTDAEPPTAPAAAAVPPLRPAPEFHSGDRIAGRYRLEECVTQALVFSSWRAVDEKLRRAVGIHLLASGHARARDALAAARQAALLGDPRFVQVLDAVEDGDCVYIVREWLPDATGLDKLLAEGPLEAYEAYEMVRQVSDALAAAHRRQLSHLRLNPSCVLRTDSGQYRVDGIAVNAALHGLKAADRTDAETQDTRALAELLFAGLTHRWPSPEGRHGLQGLPRTLGPVSAEQVRAGVHRGLSEVAARALSTGSGERGPQPITTPEELAHAVKVLPKVRQPEPETIVLPDYPQRRPAPGPALPPHVLPGAVLAPESDGRSVRVVKWLVSVLVLVAIGFASWGIAQAVIDRGKNPQPTQLQPTPGDAASRSASAGPGKLLRLTGAAEFSPLNPQTINGDQAPRAIDGKTSTSWMTSNFYGYPNFGNLANRADGSGIVVDLGSVREVRQVEVVIPYAGQTMDVLAAAPSTSDQPTQLNDFPVRLSKQAVVNGTETTVRLTTPVRTRYLLVHVTSLPASSSGSYLGGISEIRVYGS